MLLSSFQTGLLEAGCDEAGRGCLAGPVFAAAVILPAEFSHPILNDSKKLSKKQRDLLRKDIESQAIAYAVASVDHAGIDEMNILWASVKAMHLALDKLTSQPQFILVDGNRFKPFKQIPHHCIVAGDATYASIAAASILAKTYRDEYMEELHSVYPVYQWIKNKGYPTPDHIRGIQQNGYSPYHRKTFHLSRQISLPFQD